MYVRWMLVSSRTSDFLFLSLVPDYRPTPRIAVSLVEHLPAHVTTAKSLEKASAYLMHMA